MSKYHYVDGEVAFSNLDEHEMFNGQSTGAFSIVVKLDAAGAEQLESQGVRLKEYQGEMQRKFKSKFDVMVVDVDNQDIKPGSVRWGDRVTVKYSLGNKHPTWGVTPYLAAVKVIEVHEMEEAGGF